MSYEDIKKELDLLRAKYEKSDKRFQDEIASLQAELTESKHLLGDIERDVIAADRRALEYSHQVTMRDTTIDFLNNKISELEKELDQVRGNEHSLLVQRKEFLGAVEELKFWRETANKTADEADKKIKELEKERDEARATLEMVRISAVDCHDYAGKLEKALLEVLDEVKRGEAGYVARIVAAAHRVLDDGEK